MFVVGSGLSLQAQEAEQAGPALIVAVAQGAPKQELEAAELMADTLALMGYEANLVRVSSELESSEADEFGGLPVLYVGANASPQLELAAQAAELDRDGFVLERRRVWRPRVGPRRTPYQLSRMPHLHDHEWFAIVGATPQATYYGAAWVLRQHYGVEWLFPGADGLDLPESFAATVLPNRDAVVEPSFLERWLGHRHTKEQKLWSLRNGLGSRYSYNHYLARLTKPEVFKQHPQWQSRVNGELVDRVTHTGPQPNLLDPGYQGYIAGQVAEHFRKHPADASVSLGITDSLSFDERPRTQAMLEPFTYFRGKPNYSNVVFEFTNQVATQLFEDIDEGGQAFGDKVLTQLAYYYAEEVPELELHPQIMPWLTSDRAQWFDADWRAEDEALIRRWEQTGVNQLGSWDYYEGYPFFIPRVYLQIVGESLPYLHAHAVHSFFAEGVRNPGLDDPKYWLAARLLWEVDQEPETLVDAYFERCYREAAEPMRRFFDRCEAAWMGQPPPARWLKYFTAPSQAELFPPQLCEELREDLDAAAALAQSDLVRRRIARVSDSFHRVEVVVEYYRSWKRVAGQERATSADAAELLTGQKRLWEVMDGMWRSNLPLFFLMRSDPTHRLKPLPEGAETVMEEDFSDLVIPAPVVSAPEFPGLNQKGGVDGWTVAIRHTEAMRLEQAGDYAHTGAVQGLRAEGMEYCRLQRELTVEPGDQLYLRAWVRGQLSGDAQVFAHFRYVDAEGKGRESWKMDGLPPGEHGWIPLTVVAEVPEGVAKVEAELIIQNQQPGDWVDWGGVALYRTQP